MLQTDQSYILALSKEVKEVVQLKLCETESERNQQNLWHKTRIRTGVGMASMDLSFSNRLKVNQGHTCPSTTRHLKTFQNDFYTRNSSTLVEVSIFYEQALF